MIEDPQPEVGHPDLVGVGKKEADPGPDLRKVLMYAVDFAVDIPRWLRDEGKEIFEHGTPSEGSWARSE
jgi:hypothetical protein